MLSLEKTIGIITLGAIIGDIVGSRFEFDDHKSKSFNLFGGDGLIACPCEFTDDSVMTVAVADALLHRNEAGSDDGFKRLLIERMHYHGEKRLNAGYGNLFYDWLTMGKTEPYNSYGNGAAMRVSPVGWVADTLQETEHIAKLTAEVTHNHPEGIKGAQAVSAVIWMARHSRTKEEIREYIETSYYPIAFAQTLGEIRSCYEFDASCQGTVPIAMEAFYEATNFEDALRNAVSVGGDSDTLTDITAAMAEAYYNIPEWIADCAFRFLDDEMKNIVQHFKKRFQES